MAFYYDGHFYDGMDDFVAKTQESAKLEEKQFILGLLKGKRDRCKEQKNEYQSDSAYTYYSGAESILQDIIGELENEKPCH